MMDYEGSAITRAEADLAAVAGWWAWAGKHQTPWLIIPIRVEAVGLFWAFLAQYGLNRRFWLAYRLAYLAAGVAEEPRRWNVPQARATARRAPIGARALPPDRLAQRRPSAIQRQFASVKMVGLVRFEFPRAHL